jgi:hypothetical protein
MSKYFWQQYLYRKQFSVQKHVPYRLVGVRPAHKQADPDQHGVLQQVRGEGGSQETGQEDDCSGQWRD